MDYRTPIARARGLGSAKDGTHHWWMQRITAIALIPLTVWLVASLVAVGAADHARTVEWIRSPAVAIALLLTIAALFHHAQLGLQVVIEDYVHTEGVKLAAVIAVKLLSIADAATTEIGVPRPAMTDSAPSSQPGNRRPTVAGGRPGSRRSSFTTPSDSNCTRSGVRPWGMSSAPAGCVSGGVR